MSIEEVEIRVRALEAELQKATERSRLAKKAVKSAKALAKEAKREKRQARKALIAAQEEHEAALDAHQEASGEQPKVAKKPPVRKVRLAENSDTPPHKAARRRAKKQADAESTAAGSHEMTATASPMDAFPRSPGEGQDGGV